MTPLASRSTVAVGVGSVLALTVLVVPFVAPSGGSSPRRARAEDLAFADAGQEGNAKSPVRAPARPGAQSTGREEGDASGERPAPRPRDPRRLEKDETRRDFDQNCLRSGCHAQVAARPRVHAPVAVGSCSTCHVAEGKAADHDFRLAREGGELCSFCHRPPAPEAHVHEAFSEGKCTSCHDPHGGSTEALLAKDDVQEVCGECHDAKRPPPRVEGAPAEAPFEHLHAPVGKGACLSCHRAHQSTQEGLLVANERELCLSCHEPVKLSLADAAYVHEPVGKDCGACHAAHGSRVPSLLASAPRVLCISCHEDVGREPPPGHELHGALAEENSCIVCHRGHLGATEKLVVAPVGPACLSCHDREIKLASGETIANVARKLAEAKSVHKPLAEGRCDLCHRSHESEYDELLTAAHPEGPYAEFSASNYALCFSCHEEASVVAESTTKTAFRDGLENLHRVHVVREKGRTCGLCHSGHASDQAALVRESVGFGPGGWRLPIAFERTPTGGSCGPGCHEAKSYVRSGGPPDGRAGEPEVKREPPSEAADPEPR